MTQDLVKPSKFLSLVLRHKPEEIGLVLDGQGWADIDELIEKAGRHGMALTRELIARIVETSDKQRFAIDATGQRIRANQGHSVDIDLGLAPSEPPPILFHGTGETIGRGDPRRGPQGGSAAARASFAGRRHRHQGRPAARASRGAAHSSRAHAGERPCLFSLDERGVADRGCTRPIHRVPKRESLRRNAHARRRADRSQQAAADPRPRAGGPEGRRGARAGEGGRRVHERLSHHERRLAAAAADGAGPRGGRHRRRAGPRRHQRQEGRPRHLLVPAALRALPLLLQGPHRAVLRPQRHAALAHARRHRAREAQRRAGQPDGAHRHVLRIRGVPGRAGGDGAQGSAVDACGDHRLQRGDRRRRGDPPRQRGSGLIRAGGRLRRRRPQRGAGRQACRCGNDHRLRPARQQARLRARVRRHPHHQRQDRGRGEARAGADRRLRRRLCLRRHRRREDGVHGGRCDRARRPCRAGRHPRVRR